jgi:hypothetical protein
MTNLSLSIEVLGGKEKRVKGRNRKVVEHWYARVIGFQGERAVPDKAALDVRNYGQEAIAVVILWFYQAKEVKKYLSSQPRSDMVDHLVAALANGQHLAGTVEDTIEWTTINRK